MTLVHLTDDQKLMTIAAGFGFVAFVFVATVCIVQPTCFVHRKLWGKRERERIAMLAAAKQLGIPITVVTKLTKTAPPNRTNRDEQKRENSLQTKEAFQRTRGGVRDSTYSSMSSGSRCDTSIISDTIPERNRTEDGLAQGHVTVTIRFVPQIDSTNGKIIGKLNVNIKDAQDLPPRPYGSLCDPYALVQVIRDLRRLRKRKKAPSKVCEFQTQVKRKTQCPLFNEGFLVPVTKSDVTDGGVLVKVFDAEKYSNHSNLGEALLPLKDYELDQSHEHIITLDLLPATMHSGEVQLGLNYLPTSERLTIRVISFTNLRLVPHQELNEFVVRSLLYHKGRLVKRLKSLPKTTSSSSPSFDESFTFDVPVKEIDNVVFVVVLCLSSLIVSSPETPVAPHPIQEQENSGDFVGKVILGKNTKGPCLRQWETMINSPRREVIQWQALV